MTTNLDEFDEAHHEPILTSDQVQVGEWVGNTFVGECRVIEKNDYEGTTWLLVEYEGVSLVTGETKTYRRGDPIGLGTDVGFPTYQQPLFWRTRV